MGDHHSGYEIFDGIAWDLMRSDEIADCRSASPDFCYAGRTRFSQKRPPDRLRPRITKAGLKVYPQSYWAMRLTPAKDGVNAVEISGLSPWKTRG